LTCLFAFFTCLLVLATKGLLRSGFSEPNASTVEVHSQPCPARAGRAPKPRVVVADERKVKVNRPHQQTQLDIGDPRLLETGGALDGAVKGRRSDAVVERVLSSPGAHCRPRSSKAASCRYASAPGCEGANSVIGFPERLASAKRIDLRTGGCRTSTP